VVVLVPGAGGLLAPECVVGRLCGEQVRAVFRKVPEAFLLVLSYRDFIVATTCAAVILNALDPGLAVTIPVFFLIGWFVPRNTP